MLRRFLIAIGFIQDDSREAKIDRLLADLRHEWWEIDKSEKLIHEIETKLRRLGVEPPENPNPPKL